MRKWLNTYFDLSKGEFNGLMVMTILVFVISIMPSLYRLIRPDLEDIPEEQRAVGRLAASYRSPVDRRNENELFYFDPNLITSEQWQQLGLSERQARSVVKYRAKGGSFKSAKDLAKMYTISPETYTRIAPYVRIRRTMEADSDESGEHASSIGAGRQTSKSAWMENRSVVKALPVIEINQADSSMLEEIKGVGPAFARRILKYRERLGGFYRKEQLLEVFGLDSVKYKEIKTQVSVNEVLLKKIPINSVTFEELKNHPYLRYKQINAIIQYRKQHGNFSSIDDLGRVALLDRATLDRLAPYLLF